MPNSTVQANATALPAANAGEGAPHVQSGPHPTRFVDFDADDSGARQHVVADDPHKGFLVAFKALIAMPWPFDRHDIRTVAANPL